MLTKEAILASPMRDVLPFVSESRTEKAPADMVGSQILRIGSLDIPAGHVAGGLVIEYRPANSDAVHRVVLEFDEREMWVYGHAFTNTKAAFLSAYPSGGK